MKDPCQRQKPGRDLSFIGAGEGKIRQLWVIDLIDTQIITLANTHTDLHNSLK